MIQICLGNCGFTLLALFKLQAQKQGRNNGQHFIGESVRVFISGLPSNVQNYPEPIFFRSSGNRTFLIHDLPEPESL
jgi:hypothetical protein